MSVQLFNAFDRSGKLAYMRLQVIDRTDDGRPMYGWPTGGFLDPWRVSKGEWTIVPMGPTS